MNSQGHETESAENSDQTATNYFPAPNLLGPMIFVYSISILAGLTAGYFLISFRPLDNAPIPWDKFTTYAPLGAGVIAGVVAAWFWLKPMTSFLRDHTRLIAIPFLGILWGMVAGWLGTFCFWFVLSVASMVGSIINGTFILPNPFGFIIVVSLAMLIFGTIGGLGAGVICGVVWAIWTRSRK